MSTAAELSVNILANTSQFGPKMDDVRKKLHDSLSPGDSLRGLSEGLHGLTHQMQGFNSLLELGLGFHIARTALEKVHEFGMKIGEDFVVMREMGAGWGESFQSGLQHALGMKSILDEIVEAEKKAAKEAEKLADAHQRAADAERKRRDIAQGFDAKDSGRDRSLGAIDHAIQEVEDKQADARRKMAETADRMHSGRGLKTKEDREKFDEEYKKQFALERELAAERRKLMNERDREEVVAMRRRVDEEANAKDKKAREAREKARDREIEANQHDYELHQQIQKQLAEKQEKDDHRHLEQLRGQLAKIKEEARQDTGRGGALSGRAAERGSVEEAKMLDEARQAMGGNKQVELQAETNKILNEVKTILQKDKGQGVQDLGTQILAGVASIT